MRKVNSRALAEKIGVSTVKAFRRLQAVERCKYEGPEAFIAEADAPDEVGDTVPLPRRDSMIADCVLKHISSRRAKTPAQIHVDVLGDYGEVTLRSVHRALSWWVSVGRVYNVSKGRDSHGKPLPGGYIMADSPLIWSSDGLSSLMEMLDEVD